MRFYLSLGLAAALFLAGSAPVGDAHAGSSRGKKARKAKKGPGGIFGAVSRGWKAARKKARRFVRKARSKVGKAVGKVRRGASRAVKKIGSGAKRLLDKATGGDMARADTPAAKAALPPEGYMKKVGCPFARWFSKLPKRFGGWEKNLVKAYNDAWKRAKSPRGVQLNDHNYDTLLGQGNTHGFVAGSLTIDNRRIPKGYRVGLFARRAKHPVVVRLSDFGADGSPLQLGRLALKLSWPKAWGKEINWLLTESLDTFPLADYKDLATFARDPKASILQMLRTGGHIAKSILGGGLPTISKFGDGFLMGKTFYSQVPYALGKKAAMRFRFVPHNASSAKVGRKHMRKGVRQFLSRKAAVFDLEIQIHPNQKAEAVIRRASSPWRGRSAKYYRVGRLVLAKQATDADGMGKILGQALRKALRPSKAQSRALHKLFYFHPVLTAKEHRPLGEINSFRSDFYSHHAAARFRTIQSRLAKSRDRFRVPFGALGKDRGLRALFSR